MVRGLVFWGSGPFQRIEVEFGGRGAHVFDAVDVRVDGDRERLAALEVAEPCQDEGEGDA